jgi:hypothetical protein
VILDGSTGMHFTIFITDNLNVSIAVYAIVFP